MTDMKSLRQLADETGVSKNAVRVAMLRLLAEDDKKEVKLRFGPITREKVSSGPPVIKLTDKQEVAILARLGSLVEKRKTVPVPQVAAFASEFLAVYKVFIESVETLVRKYGLESLADLKSVERGHGGR
jgi:hypothetical protein